jgi:hypothetical protein
MVRSIRLVHDNSAEETGQPAEQRSLSPGDVQNLAQVKAELSYLNSLEATHETNRASLKRLKEARDALLDKGYGVAGISSHSC